MENLGTTELIILFLIPLVFIGGRKVSKGNKSKSNASLKKRAKKKK